VGKRQISKLAPTILKPPNNLLKSNSFTTNKNLATTTQVLTKQVTMVLES
jgi:hypothetical protein